MPSFVPSLVAATLAVTSALTMSTAAAAAPMQSDTVQVADSPTALSQVEQRRAYRRELRREFRRRQAALTLVQRRSPDVMAPFTLATYNTLGASHTEGPRANKAHRPDSPFRTRWATELVRRHKVDVIGLQEFQTIQQKQFKALMPGWAMWGDRDNQVAWRKSEFRFVSADTLTIPYLGGRPRLMPVVRLVSTRTGQQMVFVSVHNPASVHSRAAKRWRKVATARELRLVQDLRAANRRMPVFVVGDMNSKAKFFCPFTATGEVDAANGGSNRDGRCKPPRRMGIDWIFGTAGVTFSRFSMDRSALAQQSSDHPLVLARVG